MAGVGPSIAGVRAHTHSPARRRDGNTRSLFNLLLPKLAVNLPDQSIPNATVVCMCMNMSRDTQCFLTPAKILHARVVNRSGYDHVLLVLKASFHVNRPP